MRPLPAAAVAWCAFAAGCGTSSTGPISAPSYDPDGMAKAALQQLDKNGNGTVEGAELDAAPGLKAALPAFDTNKDKAVSADELKARFRVYVDSNAGAIGCSLTVTLDGAPLPDATVTLTPEPFMNGAVKEVVGKTGTDGTASTFAAGGESLPGVAPGVYRVAVTKDGVAIPAKFNAQTTLGCEVAGGRGGNASRTFALTSR